jgi:hypothetical protein
MSKLRLRIFDGTRQPFRLPAQFLVRITDGNEKQLVADYYPSNDQSFDRPLYDNFGDNYTVLVSANGYKQAGYQPVTLSNAYLTTLNIMLVPNTPNFNFPGGLWPASKNRHPFLAAGANDAKGEQRYNDLLENKVPSLASIHNLCEAMSQIPLAQGTPLSYIKQLIWMATPSPPEPSHRRRTASLPGATRRSSTRSSKLRPGSCSRPNLIPASCIRAPRQAGSKLSSARPTCNLPSTRKIPRPSTASPA